MPQANERKICQQCRIEIHTERVEFNGDEKYSWRNPDGSPHFFYEDGQFIHTPTQWGYLDVRLKEIEAKLDSVLEMVKR